jgi:hypothetical protein
MTHAVTVGVVSPDQVVGLARQGGLGKEALARYLTIDARRRFLSACAAIEKQYTEACTATGDPCLAGGCAVDGEICLQPLGAAGADYDKACGEAFATLFADARNRSEVWER